MSSYEKEYLFDDAIDLGGIFKFIWHSKFILLLFIFMSVPVSVYITTKLEAQFKAETVFEKLSDNDAQPSSQLSGNVETNANTTPLSLRLLLAGTILLYRQRPRINTN